MEAVKNQDGSLTVTTTVEGEKWEAAKKKAFNALRSRLNLKGFRKGTVPASYAKKLIPAEVVIERAAEDLMNPVFQKIVEENNYDLLEQPSGSIQKADEEGVTYVFTLTVRPEAELGNIEHLGVEKQTPEVTEEEVDSAIHDLLARKADWTLVEDETPSKVGDKATITFYSVEEGEPEDKLKEAAETNSLVLGANTLYADFENQIPGMKTGETKTIEFVYPDNFPSENMAGTQAKFVVTLDELWTKEVPELTDEVAAEIKLGDATTVDALKKEVYDRLNARKAKEAEDKYDQDLLDAIAKDAKVTIPSVMIDREAENMFRSFLANIQNMGYSPSEYMEAAATNPEAIKESMRSQAEERVLKGLVLDAVAKQANLEVTPEELEKEVKDLAEQMNMDAADIRRRFAADVANAILTDKIYNYIKSVQ